MCKKFFSEVVWSWDVIVWKWGACFKDNILSQLPPGHHSCPQALRYGQRRAELLIPVWACVQMHACRYNCMAVNPGMHLSRLTMTWLVKIRKVTLQFWRTCLLRRLIICSAFSCQPVLATVTGHSAIKKQDKTQTVPWRQSWLNSAMKVSGSQKKQPNQPLRKHDRSPSASRKRKTRNTSKL